MGLFSRAISGAIAFFCLFNSVAFQKNKKDISFDEKYVYEHVIVLGVDGAGNFHRNCDTPNMDKIFIEKGAWTDHCRVTTPSISAQCWGSMFTGVKPHLHKLTNDTATQSYYANPQYPTMFSIVRNAHPDAEIGSFCNWNPINKGLIESYAGVTMDTGYDDVVTEKVCAYIKDKKPELLFVQFDSVDHEGHSSGYGSEEYYESIERVDGYIGQIYDSIKDAGILDSTLLIITADHGGINDTHGGASEAEMNTFFGAVGTSINKTDKLSVYGRDLAAIVCYALDVEGNEKWDSYIPQKMFLDNMNPEERPVDEIAEHTTAATPKSGTDASIENFIDMDHLRVGMFFDEGLKDIVGKEKVKTVGTVYYPEGYYGSSIRVSSEGYLSFPEIEFGEDDFTISFWVKLDEGLTGDPVIFSNKDWNDGQNEGFAYIYNGASKFNLGNTNLREDYDYSEPDDFTHWNQITIVFDRTLRHITLYSNFEKISTDWFKKAFINSVFDSGLPLNFGQDGTGSYKHTLSAQFDDILIFDYALEDDDVAKLKEYYVK